MFTTIITILVFMLIIIVHELGHFISAKLFKVKVPEFSIGMGPALFKKQKGDTMYSLRLLPIGGYVKMVGEDEASDDKDAINNKPVWVRFIIVASGAIVNLILGFIVFFIIAVQMPSFPTNIIGQTLPNTSAATYLKSGDEIVAINGKKIWYFKDIKFLVGNNGTTPMAVTVLRNSEKLDFTLTPTYSEQSQGNILGYEPKLEKKTVGRAIKYCIYETFFVIHLVIYSLLMLITGKISFTQLSGPVGASVAIGEAARVGLSSLLSIFAMISVNVGIFNLIPFPALDGGRLFFMLIEVVRRKPIPPEKEGIVHFVGLVLLLLLMVVVTSSDIFKLGRPG